MPLPAFLSTPQGTSAVLLDVLFQLLSLAVGEPPGGPGGPGRMSCGQVALVGGGWSSP